VVGAAKTPLLLVISIKINSPIRQFDAKNCGCGPLCDFDIVNYLLQLNEY